MRIAKEDVPVRIDAPGAIARQKTDFGDVTGYGKMGAEYFSFGAGTDITELLHGLENDSCQSPHWGYVVSGEITAIYTDGGEETSRSGDLFYWPPGHSVRAEADTDIVMFSPEHEHGEVIDHIRRQVSG
ncbi:MAG: hypothetical protein ACX936_14120 [Marinobacter sp.]